MIAEKISFSILYEIDQELREDYTERDFICLGDLDTVSLRISSNETQKTAQNLHLPTIKAIHLAQLRSLQEVQEQARPAPLFLPKRLIDIYNARKIVVLIAAHRKYS